MSGQFSRFTGWVWRALCFAAFALAAGPFTGQAFAGEWSGVDETVVEHYAEQAGRSARTPFINTDQGDLLLFVFLLAGTIGGFIMGYYWRVVFKGAAKDPEADGNKSD
ncbi:MAG: cobalt ABC transporter permease [Actinobacteria bacterium]|nr:cobalt ABC transporter permease [Actinomycetota bacterium]